MRYHEALIGTLLALLATLECVVCNPDAKRLYDTLLKQNNYNRNVRPAPDNGAVLVLLGLRLTQLIDIDEKNQIMTTNVWLEHRWTDYRLQWNKEDYNGVETLYVPADEIWLPDIVLYNNADGDYVITLMTKAILHHDGNVTWNPPGIFKSYCAIDVEFFPFDEQFCYMHFGTWSYYSTEVDLKHISTPDVDGEVNISIGVDMSEYSSSAEWEILEVPAQRHVVWYGVFQYPFLDVTFYFRLRRKTLFHTINLIVPCVAISFLTVLVFYLPTESGEKTTLCISILLSLTMFFLLLSDNLPPTSLTIPLLGKYLLFTTVLVCCSIVIAVVVLNIHCRSSSTHRMSPWVRRIFLEILPRFLFMRRPSAKERLLVTRNKESTARRNIFPDETGCSYSMARRRETPGRSYPYDSRYRREHQPTVSPEEKMLILNVLCVADQIEANDKEKQMKEDWKYVAMVIDRMFLWIFTIACFFGTLGIILRAPHHYDNRPSLDDISETDMAASRISMDQ